MFHLFFFFFFKQKTAYEMRISDWSSDVCSSDLQHLAVRRDAGGIDVLGERIAQLRGAERGARERPVETTAGERLAAPHDGGRAVGRFGQSHRDPLTDAEIGGGFDQHTGGEQIVDNYGGALIAAQRSRGSQSLLHARGARRPVGPLFL